MGRGRVAALTAFWKHRDTDPVLFSIFLNDADEEAHGGLIKLDRAADFVSRVNPGLETGPIHRKKKKNTVWKNANSAFWEKEAIRTIFRDLKTRRRAR